VFPNASVSACDLLEKLLAFEPDDRLGVEEALRHPYLEELHCEEDEPICETLDPKDFYFEYLKLTKEDLRVLIEQEIVNNYDIDLYETKSAEPSFGKELLKSLPTKAKKKLRRRNSWPKK